MKTTVYSQDDIKEHPNKLPEALTVIYFKMVGVGDSHKTLCDNLGSRISDLVDEQPGYFLLSDGGVGVREAMHDLVDKFCDAQEG